MSRELVPICIADIWALAKECKLNNEEFLSMYISYYSQLTLIEIFETLHKDIVLLIFLKYIKT